MYILTISFKQHGAGLQFVYKTQDEGLRAYNHVNSCIVDSGKTLEVRDDYGQYAIFHSADILAMLLADNEEGHKAAEEKAISLARAQARTNMRAKSDGQINNQLITAPPSLKMN